MGQEVVGGNDIGVHKIKGSPSYVVVGIGEVSIPHLDVQHGAVVVVHVEGEPLVEPRVERFGLNSTLKFLRTKLELAVRITKACLRERERERKREGGRETGGRERERERGRERERREGGGKGE